MSNYFPPIFKEDNFHCPYCHVYANQEWHNVFWTNVLLKDTFVSICSRCFEKALWYKEKLLLPDVNTAPPAHEDLPADVASDYNEAASILNKSPRGSTALLRLALQRLMVELGESGKDINKDIGSLVKKGLPDLVQKSLDIVRVIGNESVHPGQMDLKDDVDTATTLFHLINFIVEDRISRPRKINDLYLKLPEGKRKGIEDRDKVNTSS